MVYNTPRLFKKRPMHNAEQLQFISIDILILDFWPCLEIDTDDLTCHYLVNNDDGFVI